MKFTCDNCKTQYLISDDKIGTRGVKVRCKRCTNVIVLQPDGSISSTLSQGSQSKNLDSDSSEKLHSGIGEKDDLGEVFDSLFKNGEKRQKGFNDEVNASDVTQLFDPEDLKRLQSQMEAADEESRKIDQVFAEAESTNVSPKAATQTDPAKKQWYIASGGEQQGPYSYQDLEVFLFEGKINASTYAWRTGLSDWLVMGQVTELTSLFGEKSSGFEREMTARVTETSNESKNWLASSDDSLLSDLVQQELQAAKTANVDKVETDYSLDEGPWAEGSDQVKDKGFFDSSIEQTTSYSVDTDGIKVDGFLDRDLARPAYLSESSKSRRLKRLVLFVSSSVFLLVVAGVVYRYFLGGELPFGLLERPASIGTADSNIKVVGQIQPSETPISPPKDSLEGDGQNRKDGLEETGAAQKPTLDSKEQDTRASKNDDPPQKPRVAMAGELKTSQPNEKRSTDRAVSGKPPRTKSPSRQNDTVKKTNISKKNQDDSTVKKKKSSPKAQDKQETLNKEQIYEVMKKAIPAMKGCVKQQLQRDPSVKGTLVVSFVINPSGKVGSVTTLSKEHLGTYVSECITYVIKEMRFPSFNGDPITVPRVPLTIGN